MPSNFLPGEFMLAIPGFSCAANQGGEMDCELTDCEKSWDPPNGQFPICLTPFCPLRKAQIELTQSRGQPSFNTRPCQAVTEEKTLVAPQVAQSLHSLRHNCGTKFVAYDMDGAQSAHTVVTLKNHQTRSFSTTDLMHSEMVAINKMIEEKIWTVYLGQVVWADDGASITSQQFTTTEPHCGFCTLFLIAAGLPVTKPTYGNYKLAGRLAYILPIDLEVSPHFMARVLDSGCYCGFPAVKRLLNIFVQLPPERWVLSIGRAAYVNDVSYTTPTEGIAVVEWFNLVNDAKREVIYQIWKVIYEQILQTNKQQQ
jgi:hypothetical protein